MSTLSRSFTQRKRIRKTFGRIREVAPMPNLIEVQKASYDSFLQIGVPAEQRKLLQKELLSWRKGDPASAAYLSEGAWTRLYPATDKDYDIVRDIWTQVGTGNP